MKQLIKFIFIFYFLSFGIVFSQNDGKFNKRGPFKQKLGGGFKTEYNVEFENGFTVTGGSVSFSGTVTFTGTSALWAADGDTVRIDPGTRKNIFEIKVDNVVLAEIDSVGQMGIGINPPTRNLEVRKDYAGTTSIGVKNNTNSSNSSATFAVISASNDFAFYAYPAAKNTSNQYVADGITMEAFNASGGFNISSAGTNHTAFWINSSEAMRIENGGLIGIGTTVPVERLHIDTAGGTDGTGRWFTNASVTTTDATTTTIYTLATSTNQAYRLFVNIIGIQDDGSNSMSASHAFMLKNVAGTVTEQGDVSLQETDDSVGVSISGAVSGTNYLIQVTGIAAETWNWGVAINAIIIAH